MSTTSLVIVVAVAAVGLSLLATGLLMAWRQRLQRQAKAWEECRRREQMRVVPREEIARPVAVAEPVGKTPLVTAKDAVEMTAHVEAVPEPRSVQVEVDSDEAEMMLVVAEEVRHGPEAPAPELKPMATFPRVRRPGAMEQLLLWPDADQPRETAP